MLLASVLAASVLAAESAELAGARALFEAGRFPEAKLAFERLLAAEPANADVHYYLGRLALDRGDDDTAISELGRAEELAPGSARVHGALGNAYGRSAQKAGLLSKYGLARKCVAEFERAAALEPANVGYHESLLEFYYRAPSLVGGGSEKAANEAAIIMRLDPRRGHRAYATLDLANGKYDLAFAELEEVLKSAPDDYASLYQLGRLAALSGHNLDRGLGALRTCLKLKEPQGAPSHAAAQWRVGNILERKGDAAGARVAYESALRLDPKFTPASEALEKLR
jgi:tetratricopeptide (TPR) repeat protein